MKIIVNLAVGKFAHAARSQLYLFVLVLVWQNMFPILPAQFCEHISKPLMFSSNPNEQRHNSYFNLEQEQLGTVVEIIKLLLVAVVGWYSNKIYRQYYMADSLSDSNSEWH